MKSIRVSFIIPAYNEALLLPAVLQAIHRHVPQGFNSEIIVADNGSQDDTVALAKANGAQVVVDPQATISRLRNLAVARSSGSILVFLDADILLTPRWQALFPAVVEDLMHEPMQVTGSRYGIDTTPSAVEKCWFEPLLRRPSVYINSGHLITTRQLFDAIGGFDESLETGEDYAFGMAARRTGAKIINNPDLEVVHKGYPKTLYQFIRREMWHGRGDCDSLRHFLSSKVALTALMTVLLQLLALGLLLTGQPLAALAALLVVVTICLLAAMLRHGARRPWPLLQTAFLYYLYFTSRFLSCLPFISRRSVRRKAHTGADGE